MISVAPTLLALAFIVFMMWRFGVGRGYLFAIGCMLWLPVIVPYPLQAVGRLVGAEDIGLTEIMCGMSCIGILLGNRVSGTGAGLSRWLAVFVFGGLVALFVAAVYEPLSGFVIEEGASFFRQACLMSLVLYVGVRGLIRDNDTAAQATLYLMIGGLMLAAIVLFGTRTSTAVDAEVSLIGRYALPLGIVIAIGGNSGAIYFCMVCLMALSLYLNGKKRSERMFGLVCWSLTFYVSMMLGTRAVWLVALPLHVMTGALGVIYCRVSRRRVISALGLPAIGLMLLYGLSVGREDYVSGRIASLQNPEGSLRDDQTVAYRVNQYSELGPVVLANPLGTGYLDEFPIEIKQPHSLILKLALTTGVLGAFGYCAFIVITAWKCVATMNEVALEYRWILVGGISVVTLLAVLSPGYDLLGRFNFHISFIFICAVLSSIFARSHAMRGKVDGRRWPRILSSRQYAAFTKGRADESGRSITGKVRRGYPLSRSPRPTRDARLDSDVDLNDR